MAGFKETIRAMNPAWFITFDGDALAGNTGVSVTGTTADDQGTSNGIIHDEHPSIKGYYIGVDSHIQPEQFDQKALRLCTNYRHPTLLANGESLFPASYIEIPRTNDALWDKDEFTLIFTAKKNETIEDNWHYLGEVGNSQIVNSMDETWLRLGNIFEVGKTYRRHTVDYPYIHLFPDDAGVPLFTFSTTDIGYNWGLQELNSDRASLVVVRYKEGLFQWIVDAHVIAEKNVKSLSGYDALKHRIPDMLNVPLQGERLEEMTCFLGGKPTQEVRTTAPKWQCLTPTELDQVSLHNRAITDDQMMALYRRVWNRQTMFLIESPSTYIPMDDDDDDIANNGNVSAMRGRPPTVFDNYLTLTTRKDGMVNGEYGVTFPSKGIWWENRDMALDFDNSWTLEFTMAATAARRVSVVQLMSIAGSNELSLWGNSNDGEFYNGWTDIRLNNSQFVSIRKDIMDGKWHKIIMRKKENVLDVYIDDVHVVDGEALFYTNEQSIGLAIFRSYERNTHLGGNLSEFIIYNKALEDVIMKSHSTVEYLYKVNGQVVKAGQPFEAKVRVYSHITGEMITEVTSDPITGNFNVYLTSNELIDLVLLDDVHNTVKIRAVGAINPDIVNGTITLTP